MIDDLSEEFVRGLSAILFECWHVDIIDEYDHLPPSWRSEKILLLPLELILIQEEILQVLRLGLRGEVEHRVDELIRTQRGEELLYDDRLPCAGLAGKQNILAVLKQLREHALELHRVRCGHEDVEVRHTRGVLELRDQLRPRTELLLLEVHVVVEHISFEREPRGDLQETLLHRLRESSAGGVVDVTANRPDEGEDQDHPAEMLRFSHADLLQIVVLTTLSEEDLH